MDDYGKYLLTIYMTYNACFTQITSSKIERSFRFDCFFSFRWVRFRSIVELNRTQSMNWIRLSSIGFDWNLVRLDRKIEEQYGCILTTTVRHSQSSVHSNSHTNSPVSPHPHPRCGNISNHYFPFWCFAHGVVACIYGLVRKDTGHNRR